MIIDNVLYYSFRFFYLFCKANPKSSATACLFVYNCVFFWQKCEIYIFSFGGRCSFFQIEGGIPSFCLNCLLKCA